MALIQKQIYTADDYWNLPANERAELIQGQLFAMSPPNFMHQKLISEFTQLFGSYIKKQKGPCEVIPAPFAVNLDKEGKNWVEPDLSVICDPGKITERGCSGAPDLILEVISPSSKKMDYIIKNSLYSDSGVREYWIVDPLKKATMIYHYEQDITPSIFSFETPIHVGIFPELSVVVADLL